MLDEEVKPGPDVLEMLALRAWALEVLAGAAAGPGGGAWDAIAKCSEASWNAFLAIERCGMRLSRRLAEAEGGAEAPAVGAAALRSAAMRESRRVLSARAQIEVLARMAREEGWRLVVLKGGVLAAGGRFELDTFDVDVLAPEGEAAEVARRLDERGFAAHSADTPHHLAARVSEGSIAVEVHRRLKEIERLDDFRRRIRPLDAVPGLWRLHPADHVWQLLVHAAVQHADRRGSIRELLLLRYALEELSAADLREIDARVAAHADGEVFERALAMARELEGGGEPNDRFRDERLAPYAVAARFGAMTASGRLGRTVGVGVLHRLTDRSSTWRAAVRTLAAPMPTPYWFPPTEWLRRRWARGGRAAHRAARLARFTVSALLAAVTRVDIARLRRRLRRSP